MKFDQSVIMVFPGQGSQQLGMLKEYYDLFPSVKETFAEVSAVVGADLWAIAQHGPAEKLNDTRFTQPIMLAADIAIWRAWQSMRKPEPMMVAGHSLGEFAALACANVLNLTDAATLVHHRANLMADSYADQEGAVGVIVKATLPEVQQWCEACSDEAYQVFVANINSPIQIVVSGHKPAVEKVLKLAKTNQAKIASLLPISVPVHCPLMKQAAEQLKQYIEPLTFNKPDMPVIFNITALSYACPNKMKDAIYQQLFKPVQWLNIMDLIMQNKPSYVVEVGPGKVLTGLFSRTFKNSAINIKSLAKPDLLQGV